MNRYGLNGLFILVLIIFAGCVSETDYQSFISSVEELEDQGNYLLAKEKLFKEMHRYPDHEFVLIKELVYVNEKLGDYKANIGLMAAAHQKEYFFLIHPSIPRYKPYIGLEGFDSLSLRDLQIRQKATDNAVPLFNIVEPESYNPDSAYPVIFIFHGGGSNMYRAEQHWQSDLLDSLFIRVFLQSRLHSDYETFGWKNSDDEAVNFLEEVYSSTISRYNIDTANVFLAGISAGGTAAVYSVFRSCLPVKAYIGICTGIPGALQFVDYSGRSEIRAFMISGDKDHYLPRQKNLARLYDSANIRYHFEIIKGMGHNYPENMSSLIDESVRYLLDDIE